MHLYSPEQLLLLEDVFKRLENLHASFDYIKITLASPHRIQSWAMRTTKKGKIQGEIFLPDTINFRTHEPEPGGLFCENIFGPIRNWRCQCGKYYGSITHRICEICESEVTEARTRRYRMGFYELLFPVVHLWYLKAIPSYLLLLLKCLDGHEEDEKLSILRLEQIVYFRIPPKRLRRLGLYKFAFLMGINSDFESSEKKEEATERVLCWFENRPSILITSGLSEKVDRYINNSKRFRTREDGHYLLSFILDLFSPSYLKQIIASNRRQMLLEIERRIGHVTWSSKALLRRIRLLESFLLTKTHPSWMMISLLPIIPPQIRPFVELENGLLLASDINEIYRLIIFRTERLGTQLSLNPFSKYFIQALLLTQESVDILIDNARLPKDRQYTGTNDLPLRGLTEILEGKEGRFRHCLLGKRVDYSGRSVIIVGPSLRMNQCGLPYEIAKELFEPFLIQELAKTKMKLPNQNIKLAQFLITYNRPFIWKLLILLTQNYSVLLNRAPTLHRFGIQAFDPVLVLGQAIHLHPLVCTGFNADFDGDQMAVHLPLYQASQLEIRTMMRPCFHFFSPAAGEVILKPTQDMVIGSYYLTLMIHDLKFENWKWFANENEVIHAFYQKKLTIHTPILVRYCLSEFHISIHEGKIWFHDSNQALPFLTREVIIKKIFQRHPDDSVFYLITNLGIFITESLGEEKYSLRTLFLESTPGRLLFAMNVKKALKQKTTKQTD